MAILQRDKYHYTSFESPLIPKLNISHDKSNQLLTVRIILSVLPNQLSSNFQNIKYLKKSSSTPYITRFQRTQPNFSFICVSFFYNFRSFQLFHFFIFSIPTEKKSVTITN